jgi:anti-sigma factor RsiW
MHIVVTENLEAYLSGCLPAVEREKWDAHLAECSECRAGFEELKESAKWLHLLRPPQDVELEPATGFYARVVERIDQQREIPFWAMLLDPSFGRRIVFACLVLLALLGAYVASVEQGEYPGAHRPEAILAGPPTPIPAPRLGADLDRNRGAMLVVLAAETD